MRKLLTTLGPPTTDQSWFVTYDFERPLEKWPILKQQIEAALTNSLLQPSVKRHYLVVNDRFRLAVMPASTVSSQKFVVGGYSDDDSGGWTLHELQRNAQLCVDEKTKKVAAYQNRYSEWWLLLANYISYSISGLELELFDPRLAIPAPWSRVIFVNPLKPTLGLEFHPRGRPSNR